MLLYIIRHGDPIYDPDSLTPKGHLQAQALAKRLALHGLDKIYVSPLKRAQQTAQPTCELLGLTPQVEEWASEHKAYADLSVEHPDGHRSWVFHQQRTNLKNNDTVNLGAEWYQAKCFDFPDKDFKKGYERIQNDADEFLRRQGYDRDGCVYRITRPNEERIALFCHPALNPNRIPHCPCQSPVFAHSASQTAE